MKNKKYHFITSKGERLESNNLGELKILAHKEPCNWVKIYMYESYIIGTMGAKQYNKYLHRMMICKIRKGFMNGT